MHAEFWHERWKQNQIGFHESEGSHLLKKFFEQWNMPPEALVFVPLCGKTRDIAWLLNKGLRVVAIELNESAVIALFEELGVKPIIKQQGDLVSYTAPDLCVYVGDFFALNEEHLGCVNGIYDRAALVALPSDLRKKYGAHLRHITHTQKQLLITYDYDQSLVKGPPFSVNPEEVALHYAEFYALEHKYRDKIKGGFRGQDEVFESVYMLS